jgi:hypothetical protein
MMTTVDLSFRYVERDYVRALRAHYALRLHPKLDTALAFVLAAVGVYLWRWPDLHWFGVVSVVVSVVFATVLIAAFMVIPPLAFRRQPKLRNDYLLSFSPDGIHFHTANIDSQIQWGLYSRALVDAHSYVLYYGSNQFTVIPKRAFQTAEKQQVFEHLLVQHVPKIIRRSG